MSTTLGPITAAFSYMPNSLLKSEEDKRLQKVIVAFNVLGYIPIIQTITGIARMVFGALLLKKPNNLQEKTYSKALIARGAIETFLPGVGGLVLAITDVANRYRFHITWYLSSIC